MLHQSDPRQRHMGHTVIVTLILSSPLRYRGNEADQYPSHTEVELFYTDKSQISRLTVCQNTILNLNNQL